MTAITAITAQNTVAVTDVLALPPATIVGQVRALVDDIGVDAVKVGMLGTVATIDAVAEALELVGDAPIVVDPVMVSESGATLLEPEARAALVARIVERATVVTPNLPEARVLAGLETATPAELARAVYALGPGAVVVTGGHADDGADRYFAGDDVVEIPGERHPDGATHGSGCTHSAVLAAQLALGVSPLEAARTARAIAAAAVRDGLREIGAGPGPVDVLGLARRGS